MAKADDDANKPAVPDPFQSSPPAPLRRRGSLFAKEQDGTSKKTTITENGTIRHTFSNRATCVPRALPALPPRPRRATDPRAPAPRAGSKSPT